MISSTERSKNIYTAMQDTVNKDGNKPRKNFQFHRHMNQPQMQHETAQRQIYYGIQ